jgi:hypothetical protein
MAQATGGGIAGMIGSSVGEAAAFAAGLAIAPLLEPVVQELKSVTWSQYPDRPLDAGTVAEAVAEGFVKESVGASEAALSGISGARFDHLVQNAYTAPAVAEARELVRRRNPATGQPYISTDQLHLAYRKAKIDPAWFQALDVLLDQPLPPAVAALAAVRGLIPSEGTLLVDPPNEKGKVEGYPQQPLSGLAAAAAAGFSPEAYKVMVGINGRPMSLHEAASAYFRHIIDLADFHRAVSEGDTRNEWRDAILEQAREIPSTTNYIEGHVRDWISADQMYAGTALHGMSQADTDLLFLTHGRPLTHSQVFVGLLRGGTYDGPIDEIDPAFLKSLRESDMRPEWYNLAWHARYHYPPLFQTVNLLKNGVIQPADATDWLLKQAYEPTAVAKIVEGASKTGAAKTKTLTPAQIRSAVGAGALTRVQGLDRLQALGYSGTDAELFLDLPSASASA